MVPTLAFAVLLLAQAPPSETPPAAPLLDLRELVSVQDGKPDLSPKARSLAGQRVRLRGWLVVFEEAPADGFWLAPRPVFQDESGAGSGELPPTAVRVTAPPEVLAALPADPIALEVDGILLTGRETDAAGRSAIARVRVGAPGDVRLLERRAASPKIPPSALPAAGANVATTKEEAR
jgi:hypothetical protein